MTTQAPHRVQLTESAFTPLLEDNLRDSDQGIIRNVKIIGKVSKNGRIYSDEALKEAVPMYESVPVYIDHPDKKFADRERSLREQVGVIRDARWTADGDFGDLHLFENHGDTKLLIERAQKDKNGFGLSHNAEGTCIRTNQGEICESISNVRSVDIVGKPATTRGLFESETPDEPEEKTMKKFTLKELVESHGSADEKQHISLLEDAAVLNREVELEEDAASVANGFGKAITESLQSSDRSEFASLTGALKVLREGAPKPPEPSEDDGTLKNLQEQVKQLTEERDRMKLEKEIKTLCESESFKPDEFQMETLSLLESAEKRIKLIHTWKDSGRPERSGRKDFLENVGSYEEELAKLQAQK